MSSLTAARMSYAAAVVGCMTYGIYVLLAGICIYYQLQHRHQTKGRYVLIVYTCSMFIVSTVYFCCAAKWSEIEFVESTVNPAVFATLLSSKLAITKDTASVVNIWLADSLLIYRTYVIWGGNLCILILPVIMFFGAVASSLALLIETARPGATFGQSLISDFGTAFWSISVSLNVISTLLIAGQLLWHRRSLRRAGLKESDQYLTIAAILAESAALYSVSGLIYIPLFARDLALQYPFSALFNSAASIAPNLIILRMALGVAAHDSRTTGISTTLNIASMPDSQFSKKRTTNILTSSRSQQGSTIADTDVSPARTAFKSVHTLANESSDFYPMNSYKRDDAV